MYLLSTFFQAAANQDWTGLGDPLASSGAQPGNNRRWEIDWDLSDSFYYDNKQDHSFAIWRDYNPLNWKGPGATLFNSNNVFITDAKLKIKPSKVPSSLQGDMICYPHNEKKNGCRCTDCFHTRRTVYTAYVTSKVKLFYPCYTEARIKGSSTALASNFWLKSSNTEIDINESYGDSDLKKFMTTNVHFFNRHNPDGGPKSLSNQVYIKTNNDLTATFNRFGVHWKDATHVDFYFNGKKVRELDLKSRNGVQDPTGKYLNEHMRLIVDLEAHKWRRYEGVPKDWELQKSSDNEMVVDWIRTYRAVPI